MNKAINLFPGFKPKAFTMSFDDDCDTNGRMVELLKKYQLKATFNLNGGQFAKDKPNGNSTEEEAIEMFNNEYCEVASHGYDHACHGKIPTPDAMMDIIMDRLKLEEMFGKLVRGYVAPYGSYTDATIEIAKNAGLVYNRTCKASNEFFLPKNWFEWNPTCSIVEDQCMDLTRKFVADPNSYYDGKLFYAWAHTYECVNYCPWDKLEEFLQLIAFKKDIWYATNIEVYDYVNAYRSLIYYANAKKVYNPTHIDVYLGGSYGKFLIPAGQTVTLCK